MSTLHRSGVVVLDGRDCSAIADGLHSALVGAQQRGEPVADHVIAAVGAIVELGDAWRKRPAVLLGTRPEPVVAPGSTEAIEWLSVKQKAAQLGTSERNVTARAKRGTLAPARKERGTWRIAATAC